MLGETAFERAWRTLRNPFQSMPDTTEIITSHISGRSADIREIILGGQSAIILSGAPHTGKTALIRYLRRPPDAEWSWRNELAYLADDVKLADIRFAQIDLAPLDGIEDEDALLVPFIEQCILALQSMWQGEVTAYSGIKGLRDVLRRITREHREARIFLMLDTIERLQGPDMSLLKRLSKAQTPQERGMALLDRCGAFRLLVDLLEEFSQLGVLLSIESLPLPKITNQFTHVSADLARFSTMTLQTFTRTDTMQFLAQEPEGFGPNWARQFRGAGGDALFTQAEQTWLYEQTGTHPYLLQQFCFHMFKLKREYSIRSGMWTELQQQEQLIELVNGRVSTFLDLTWKRVKEAMEASSPETTNRFKDFILQSREKKASEEIEQHIWNNLGQETRYILSSEGLVRYDFLLPIFYPGSMLLNHLAQKTLEEEGSFVPVLSSGSPGAKELIITLPGNAPEGLTLSDIEYRLLKLLLQRPWRYSEEDLMKAAWGKVISRPVFTQRMYHLRKKLQKLCGDEEVIENRYGGIYMLNNMEWFHLQ